MKHLLIILSILLLSSPLFGQSKEECYLFVNGDIGEDKSVIDQIVRPLLSSLISPFSRRRNKTPVSSPITGEVRRRKERRMSRCFNWFPFWWIRRTLYIPQFGLFYKNVGRLWKESAPELMGVKSFLELVRLVLLKKYGSSSSRRMEKT